MDIDKTQSATTKFKSPSGFEWLYSLRSETANELVKQLEIIEKVFIEKGFTPLAQNTFASKPQVPTKLCERHNVPMKERNGTNGKFYSHSKGVYPNMDYCSGNGFRDEREYEGA